MKEHQLKGIDPNDPLFHAKTNSIQSQYQIVTLIKENKREIYSKIYYIFSLLFSIFVTLYWQSFGLLSLLIVSNVSLAFLVYWAWDFYLRRIDLADKKEKIGKNLKEFGIELED